MRPAPARRWAWPCWIRPGRAKGSAFLKFDVLAPNLVILTPMTQDYEGAIMRRGIIIIDIIRGEG